MKCMSPQQMSLQQLGDIPPGAPQPTNVTGELDLTQGFGPLDNGTYLTRGYYMTPPGVPYFSNASQVRPHMSLAFQSAGMLYMLPISGINHLVFCLVQKLHLLRLGVKLFAKRLLVSYCNDCTASSDR